MWILPSVCSRSAQDSGGLTLALAEQSVPEWWATVSGTASPRPVSWRGWKNRPWIKPLFGLATCETWTPDLLPAKSISTQGDTPANPLATAAQGAEKPTSATFGPSSGTTFASYDPPSHSLRMSEGTFPWGSSKSSATLPLTGMMCAGLLSAHQKPLELHTYGNASSSSATWPTPTATDAKASGAAGYSTQSGRHSGTTLTDATVRSPKWETPTARDWKDGTNPSMKVPTNALLGRQAPRMIGQMCRSGSSLPSKSTIRPLRLNPCFVAWLMGLPNPWWAQPNCSEPTSSEL